ncbi:hypothetical protein KIN20_028822 [Parelaphostrongylus tenuis]|uniref:Uncharacterized protein n=1 Tax=Parelaphostrongylus tenuis TaxID=148309 RepID=A0AAD5R1Q5_PARTN|nr:hypothetical protein KIN20_028822 [Parelaphostrongylus tenuis]
MSFSPRQLKQTSAFLKVIKPGTRTRRSLHYVEQLRAELTAAEKALAAESADQSSSAESVN